MARYIDPWDRYHLHTTSSSSSSATWYDYDWLAREQRLYREMKYRYEVPKAKKMTEEEAKALLAPKKDDPLAWLHRRVNEICDEALSAVA